MLPIVPKFAFHRWTFCVTWLLICPLGHAASPPPPPPSLAIAYAPMYTPGEQWVLQYIDGPSPKDRRTTVETVVSVDARHGRTTVDVNHGRMVSVLDSNGNVVQLGHGSFSPSDSRLRFPLRVGDAWHAKYTYDNGSLSIPWTRDARVVGTESLVTPAGTFDTFKIFETLIWKPDDDPRDQGSTTITLWYAPAVGRVVREDTLATSSPGRVLATQMMMTHFSLTSSDVVSPPTTARP